MRLAAPGGRRPGSPVPEIPLLEALRALARAARLALWHEHPTLTDGAFHEACPPASLVSADLLVRRLDELDDLLAWYALAVEDATASPPGLSDDLPF